MRILPFLFASGAANAAAAVVWVSPSSAQVNEAERAAARDLFKQGDELQRAQHFAEALDKFQRAQQVFAAPTNELRIAECDAALGRLVESAESYRSVARTTLTAGSPPAFQAAIDQAKAELGQVEPRVPELVVQVAPVVQGTDLLIDGQSVPAALIGEPMPLDPGTHRVAVSAAGYATVEQVVFLRERETRPVQFVLRSLPPVPPAAPLPPPAPVGPPPPPPLYAQPLYVGERPPRREGWVGRRERSRLGLLVGGHLGIDVPSGKIPIGNDSSIDASSVGSAGFAYGADLGLRFARHWYVGGIVEHANLGHGTGTELGPGTSVRSDTTLFGVTFGFIGNPDWTSFYAEVGVANRWLHYQSAPAGVLPDHTDNNAEFTLGAGVWIPVGRSVRLLPKATLGLGTFDQPDEAVNDGSNAPFHAFFMVGVAGFYNVEF
jgi:hypothetical protein